MSLWTCIACAARRAVGLVTCPQCGAADHEEGDTISAAEGVQGQPHVPAPYADATPPAAPAAPVTPAPAPVVPAQRTEPTPAADAPPEAPEA